MGLRFEHITVPAVVSLQRGYDFAGGAAPAAKNMASTGLAQRGWGGPIQRTVFDATGSGRFWKTVAAHQHETKGQHTCDRGPGSRLGHWGERSAVGIVEL